MPLCQGCGASYDDNFKFCPHCGRAKPEPQAINLNVQVAPVRYEEAVLKLEVVGTAELTEPPFDRRPSGLVKLLGEGGRNWTQITTFRLLVGSHHPERGEYTAYGSDTFRGFDTDDLLIPDSVKGRKSEFQRWVEDLLGERKLAWEETTRYLTQEGWSGITDNATKRKDPFSLSPPYDDKGRLLTYGIETYLEVGALNHQGSVRILTYWAHDYRYRRIAS